MLFYTWNILSDLILQKYNFSAWKKKIPES